MTHLKLAAALLLATLLAACSDPAPVELIPPPEASDFELAAVAAPDTSSDLPQVDSSAVLPADRARFQGYLGITRLVLDNGDSVHTGAFSRLLLEDRNRPVRYLGRTWGFHGVNLGALTLNGTGMLRIPHRIRIRRPLLDSAATAGVEYLLDLSATHAPGQQYTWIASSPDSVTPFTLGIVTPNNITVQAPAGGSVVNRARDLPLRWTGEGNLSVVISGYTPATRKTVPLLRLRPRSNTGSLVLPRNVLRLLPADRFRFFAFSFILENRSESATVGRYDGAILIQAASVYTTFVELR